MGSVIRLRLAAKDGVGTCGSLPNHRLLKIHLAPPSRESRCKHVRVRNDPSMSALFVSVVFFHDGATFNLLHPKAVDRLLPDPASMAASDARIKNRPPSPTLALHAEDVDNLLSAIGWDID